MIQAKLTEEINLLKKERNALIIAHNYQINEVQDVADYVGDSFGLSKLAAETDAETIVFCGVSFMAESAAILAPEKTVLLPEKQAGCPLADTITAEKLRAEKIRYPEAAVVCYVNSSAAVKAESDICCTSSNAVKVVDSLPNKQILFVPDKNLAHYVSRFTDKEIIPWKGCCMTHHRVKLRELEAVRKMHPDGAIIVHPECRPEIVEHADYVGSTSGILKFASESNKKKIIIGTEMGMLHRLKKENPDKEFYLLSPSLVCPNMKLTNLAKVKISLETMEPKITVPEDVRVRAYETLKKMLAV